MSDDLFSRELRGRQEVLSLSPFKLIGPFHGMTTRYEIVDGKRLRIEQWLRKKGGRTVEISDISGIDIRPPCVFTRMIFDCGTLVFRVPGGSDSDPFMWEKIKYPAKIKEHILSLKDDLGNDREEAEPSEAELCNQVLYFPHIPRAVDQLLKAIDPSKYNASSYSVLARRGQWVKVGDVISRYGDIEITSPYDGRIEFIGGSSPGLFEWPDQKAEDLSVPPEVDWHRYRENNKDEGDLIFDPKLNDKDVFSFGIRPLMRPDIMRDDESVYYLGRLRHAFDSGRVWRDEARRKGMTFYTLIDDAVFELKEPGSWDKFPKSLRSDKIYIRQLYRYWDLINEAGPVSRPFVTKWQAETDSVDVTRAEWETTRSYELLDDEDDAVWTATHEDAAARFDISLPYTKAQLDARFQEQIRKPKTENISQIKTDYRLLLPFAV